MDAVLNALYIGGARHRMSNAALMVIIGNENNNKIRTL